jgi:hypothetical protein
MPGTKSRDGHAAEDHADRTLYARRRARFTYMSRQIDKIRDGEPQLTSQELADLARRLLDSGRGTS